MTTRMFLWVVAIGGMSWASGCVWGEAAVCCHRGATYEFTSNLSMCTSSGGTQELSDSQCSAVCCTVGGTSRMTSQGQCRDEGATTWTDSCADASAADGS